MNTDAPTVEDMNITQIIERLSMSCIESSGERFSICRNRSFTPFRNERDFRERSDSAAVSESISISTTNLLDTGLPVLVPYISPDFLTWEDHLSSLFQSEEFDELASITGLPVPVCCTSNELRTLLTFRFGVRPVSDAVEASTVGSLTRHLDTKFVIGFDVAVTLSSPASSCVLFDIAFTLVDGAEMANYWTNTKDDSIHRVWNFPLSVCLRVGFWCQCIWFGFWCPNSFYRTTNQRQLCRFWKHVLLSGFFLLRSYWSLLRCLQTHTTKLPDEKNSRLRK